MATTNDELSLRRVSRKQRPLLGYFPPSEAIHYSEYSLGPRRVDYLFLDLSLPVSTYDIEQNCFESRVAKVLSQWRKSLPTLATEKVSIQVY